MTAGSLAGARGGHRGGPPPEFSPVALHSSRRHPRPLLADIHDQTQVSYLCISHDLAVVRQLTQETVVMWRGKIVERGPTAQVLDDPRDDYTRRLRASVPHPGWKPPHRAQLAGA